MEADSEGIHHGDTEATEGITEIRQEMTREPPRNQREHGRMIHGIETVE
jgi:hypothetical protein